MSILLLITIMKGVTRMIKVKISVIVFWPFKADNTEIIIRCLKQSTTTTFLLVHLSIVVTAKKIPNFRSTFAVFIFYCNEKFCMCGNICVSLTYAQAET